MTHLQRQLCCVEPFKVHLTILYSSELRTAYENASERLFNDETITKIISFQSVFDNQKLYFKCHSEDGIGYDTIEGKLMSQIVR